jgi:hypothetical protein
MYIYIYICVHICRVYRCSRFTHYSKFYLCMSMEGICVDVCMCIYVYIYVCVYIYTYMCRVYRCSRFTHYSESYIFMYIYIYMYISSSSIFKINFTYMRSFDRYNVYKSMYVYIWYYTSLPLKDLYTRL